MSALVERHRRALGLSAGKLTQECIDYLQNPDVILAEFTETFREAAQLPASDAAFDSAELCEAERPLAHSAVARIFAAPFVRIEADLEPEEYDFSCLAKGIAPSARLGADRTGLDYVGLTCDPSSTPILGVADDSSERTGFLPLLRLLASVAELAADSQLQRANRHLFQGGLRGRVPFDLHILDVGGSGGVDPGPLAQLTQDLAFIFVDRLRQRTALPPLIRHVIHLRMLPRRSGPEEILVEKWRV